MGFKIKVDPEDPRPPVKPPINYMSNALRIRMFVLFAMLILVLIMMKEARKPEHWEWMGFDKRAQPQIGPAHVDDDREHRKTSNSARDGEPRPDRVALTADKILQSDANDYPIVAGQFWRESFGSLKTGGQRTLFQLLSRTCDRTPLGSNTSSARLQQFVDSIESKREQFHGRLAEHISFLPQGAAQTQKLSDELEKSKRIWEERILPAWKSTLAEEDITLSQQNAHVRLALLLDALALDQVEDGTALNRASEGSAWLLCWRRAMSILPESGNSVKHIQLTGQPKVYRGKPVSVDGWIRSAKRLNVKQNEMGIDHYFVLWVRPAETNVAPYCVYTRKIPEGFPHIGGESVELNERVTVEGIFFKIRSYTAGNGQVMTCPLLLSDSFEWNPVVLKNSVDDWFPPAWATWSFLLLMPIVAAVIAWLAFTGSKTRQFVPGSKTQEKISNALVDLQHHPEIQTDLERVKALNDLEDADSNHNETDPNEPEV